MRPCMRISRFLIRKSKLGLGFLVQPYVQVLWLISLGLTHQETLPCGWAAAA